MHEDKDNSYFQYTSDSLNRISDLLKKSIAPLIEQQLEVPYEIHNSVKKISATMYDSLSLISNDFTNSFKLFSDNLSAIMEEAMITSLKFDFSKFISGISIQNNNFVLSKDSYKSAVDFLDSPKALDSDLELDCCITMSAKEFIITIFIPVFLTLLTLLQNSYYHKMDALEEQKHQMEIQEYNQQMLILEKEQTELLQTISDSINEFTEFKEYLQEFPKSDSVSAEFLTHFEESHDTVQKSSDESYNSDMN